MTVSSQSQSGHQLILGKILLERGVLTPDQLKDALAERARRVSGGDTVTTSLGKILVEKGYLTGDELNRLMVELKLEPDASPPPPSGMAPSAPIGLPPLEIQVRPPAPPGPEAATPGQLGKYALLRELGRGGMGVVHEALDTQLNRKVALKLMLTNPSADPKEVAMEEERFIRESQLSAKLKHPNIVTVYEAGVLDGRQYLAMELIEGQPLGTWRQEAQVSLRQQVEVLRDVALAVHYAHEQGILHRDLKPRNILVGAGNHPFVTDFGLAKTLGKNVSNSLTGQGMVVGTPAYMSPEQAQGLDKIDWRTDIYSLGVILYEILTGTTPFTGESPIEILMKVVKDPVKPPSHVVTPERAMALDRTIENICLKALAKVDRDRYITTKAFADDITKWLQGEDVRVALPKRKRKFPVLAASIATFVGLSLVGGAYLYITLPPSVSAELGRARRFMDQKNYTEALIAFSQALAKNPDNVDAIEGEKEARGAIEREKKEKEAQLRGAMEKARLEAEEAVRQAAEKSRAEESAASDAEKQRLAAERLALLERAKRAEEAAGKAGEELRRTTAKSLTGPSSYAPDDPWRQSVNLLPLVAPPRDAVWGAWTLQDGGVASDHSGHARLLIPYQPPEEYDLRAEFVRVSGSDGVVLVLASPKAMFAWVMGGAGNTIYGFESVGGQRASQNPTTLRASRCLENDRSYTALIQVRKDGVRALLDGQPLAHLKTDYSDVALDAAWQLRATGVLGLGSHESPTLFRRLELLEVSGKGAAPAARPPTEFRAIIVDTSTLKPGLVGEYYYGIDFGALAARRVDPAIAFDWKAGPAWKDGPADSFSCRWTGYLHVPRSGRYFLGAVFDDGGRVILDGVQVLTSAIVQGQTGPEAECLLERGFHRIEVEHYEKVHQASVVLSWSDGPLAKLSSIPGRLFFHASSGTAPDPSPVPESLAVLHGHSDSVACVAFSPDGAFLATASQDRKVKLWNVATRKDTLVLGSHAQGAMAVVFSPNGKQAASGGYDKKVRVWDVAKGLELHTMDGPTDFVDSLAYNRDGSLLASGSNDGTLRLWDPARGVFVRGLSGHQGGITSVTFSPDGRRLASSSTDRTVRIWDPAAGKELAKLVGHADWVESAAFSPDGTLLASAGWDYAVKLWDAASGREVRSLSGHRSEVMAVAFRDQKTLISGGRDSLIRIWDIPSGREIRTLPGHAGHILTVAVGPDGKILASGSVDGTVRLWSLDVR